MKAGILMIQKGEDRWVIRQVRTYEGGVNTLELVSMRSGRDTISSEEKRIAVSYKHSNNLGFIVSP